YAFAYAPIGKSVVLAGRADTRGANGDVPFYLLPFVDLRGVPAMRLQDRRTAVIETEARWNVTPRWALVGFARVGNEYQLLRGHRQPGRRRWLSLPDRPAARDVRRDGFRQEHAGPRVLHH